MKVHARTREQNGSESERQWGDAVRGGMGGGTVAGFGFGLGMGFGFRFEFGLEMG